MKRISLTPVQRLLLKQLRALGLTDVPMNFEIRGAVGSEPTFHRFDAHFEHRLHARGTVVTSPHPDGRQLWIEDLIVTKNGEVVELPKGGDSGPG